MTTEQTAQQLELAAQILRTGHPWEVRYPSHTAWCAVKPDICPAVQVVNNCEIRPVLATPPDNRPLHNPDSLTAEQVGIGYRLVCYDDKTHADKLEKWTSSEWVVIHTIGQRSFRHCASTYRLPLSVPWPEPADPYAELKAAHAAGRRIQGFIGGHWIDSPHPTWKYPVDTYRVKPDEPVVCAVVKPEPAFRVPPPPPGMRWHREDGWKADDLPSGYRPLVAGEKRQDSDDVHNEAGWLSFSDEKKEWPSFGSPDKEADSRSFRSRTTRPLTFEHAGKTWTWHRPGDPMPCEHGRGIEIYMRNGQIGTGNSSSYGYWDELESGTILGWRYADEKKTVPLGRDDVTPFTRLRVKVSGENHTAWITPLSASKDGVVIATPRQVFKVSWESLLADYERNESLATGKWNPDAWEPCHKTIPQNG